MKRFAPVALLLVAAILVTAMACASKQGTEATSPVAVTATPGSAQAEESATATPTAVATATPASPIAERGTAPGRGGIQRLGGPIITIRGADGSTYFVPSSGVSLPVIGPESATCGRTETAVVEFLQDSIIVPGVSLRLAYVAPASQGDELWLIAGWLEGARVIGDEDPIAVWATLAPGGRGLEHWNTWAANSVAAEYSSLQGASGGGSAYGRLPGFEDLQECIRDARGPAELPVWPFLFDTGFLPPQPPATPTPVRIRFYCDRPDQAAVRAIAFSLKDPEAGFHRIVTARPSIPIENFITVVVAEVDWPGLDNVRPRAVWIVAETRAGELQIMSANLAAQEFSNLPGPSGLRYVPEDAPGYQEALACL